MTERRYATDILARLNALSLTEEGKQFVIKALDPVFEGPAPGIPDESTVNVLRPLFRTETTIGPPAFTGIGPAPTTWDLLLVSTPGDVNACYWASGFSTTDFTATAVAVGGTTGCIAMQPTFDQPQQTTYISWTDSSVVSYAVRTAASRPYAFRTACKSLTCELDAAAVVDQGRVYAAQFAPIQGIMPISTAMLWGDVTNTYRGISTPIHFGVPLSETVMATMAPDYFTGLARDGVYMPHRLSGAVRSFAKAQVQPVVANVWGTGTISSNIGVVSSPYDLATVIPFVTGGDELGAYVNPWMYTVGAGGANSWRNAPTGGVDSGFSNVNIGVIIFRGLSISSTVKIKAVLGLEIMPSAVTPDVVYAQPALSYDQHALAAYFTIANNLEDAYPASYNLLGDLLRVIKDTVGQVWPVLRKVGGAADRIVGGILPASAGAMSARSGAFGPLAARGGGFGPMTSFTRPQSRVRLDPPRLAYRSGSSRRAPPPVMGASGAMGARSARRGKKKKAR